MRPVTHPCRRCTCWRTRSNNNIILVSAQEQHEACNPSVPQVYLLAHKKLMPLPKLEKAVTSVGLEFHALLPDDVAKAEAKRAADKAREEADAA